DNLRTWMIKRKKSSSVPTQNRTGVRLEPEFMIGNRSERFKSDTTECGDYLWLNEFKYPDQICRTIFYFRSGRSPIGIRRRPGAAHYGASDEDIVTSQIDRIEEYLKIVTGFVAEERA